MLSISWRPLDWCLKNILNNSLDAKVVCSFDFVHPHYENNPSRAINTRTWLWDNPSSMSTHLTQNIPYICLYMKLFLSWWDHDTHNDWFKISHMPDTMRVWTDVFMKGRRCPERTLPLRDKAFETSWVLSTLP